jgi:hypothetical protein
MGHNSITQIAVIQLHQLDTSNISAHSQMSSATDATDMSDLELTINSMHAGMSLLYPSVATCYENYMESARGLTAQSKGVAKDCQRIIYQLKDSLGPSCSEAEVRIFNTMAWCVLDTRSFLVAAESQLDQAAEVGADAIQEVDIFPGLMWVFNQKCDGGTTSINGSSSHRDHILTLVRDLQRRRGQTADESGSLLTELEQQLMFSRGLKSMALANIDGAKAALSRRVVNTGVTRQT